jgi:hypothetical protein
MYFGVGFSFIGHEVFAAPRSAGFRESPRISKNHTKEIVKSFSLQNRQTGMDDFPPEACDSNPSAHCILFSATLFVFPQHFVIFAKQV